MYLAGALRGAAGAQVSQNKVDLFVSLFNLKRERLGSPREGLAARFSCSLFLISSPTYLVPIRRVSLRPPGGPQGVMCVLLRISVVWSINIGHLRSNDRVLCCKVHALEVGRN